MNTAQRISIEDEHDLDKQAEASGRMVTLIEEANEFCRSLWSAPERLEDHLRQMIVLISEACQITGHDVDGIIRDLESPWPAEESWRPIFKTILSARSDIDYNARLLLDACTTWNYDQEQAQEQVKNIRNNAARIERAAKGR